MEMCHQKGSKESVSGLVDSTGRNGVLDESLPVAMDDTLPLSLDEDLGGKGCYSYWDMIVNLSVCNYFKKKKCFGDKQKQNQTNKQNKKHSAKFNQSQCKAWQAVSCFYSKFL